MFLPLGVGLYELSDSVLSLARQEPSLLEKQLKEFEALGELEKSKFGLADAKLEEASEKYAAAAQKAITLQSQERKLRVQVVHSKLMKKVLETKLKAAEGQLGSDLGLQKGQSFGFSNAQSVALQKHGVNIAAISNVQNAVTTDSFQYSLTQSQKQKLQSAGVSAASVDRAEKVLNAHITESQKSTASEGLSSKTNAPGWTVEEAQSLLQESEGHSDSETGQTDPVELGDDGSAAPEEGRSSWEGPSKDPKEDVFMLEAYLSRENSVKATLVRAQNKATALAKEVLTAEHNAREAKKESETQRKEEEKTQLKVKEMRKKTKAASVAIRTVKHAIASVEQAKEAIAATGPHMEEVKKAIFEASKAVPIAEANYLECQTNYEKELLAAHMTPSSLKRDGARMKSEDGKAVVSKIQELNSMVEKAQRGMVSIVQKPRAVSAALRDANLKLVRLESDVKTDPKEARILEKLQVAAEHQRDVRRQEEATHAKMITTVDELRRMRDELKDLELQAELADAVQDKELRSSEARKLSMLHVQAMNAEEEASKAHYNLDALKHTKVMILESAGRADLALQAGVKHLQRALAISTRARADHKLAAVDATSILRKAKVVRAAAKARNEALVDQLEKRVAERNTSPFLSKEKREAEAGASFVNLNGNDFTAKYGAYMPTE